MFPISIDLISSDLRYVKMIGWGRDSSGPRGLRFGEVDGWGGVQGRKKPSPLRNAWELDQAFLVGRGIQNEKVAKEFAATGGIRDKLNADRASQLASARITESVNPEFFAPEDGSTFSESLEGIRGKMERQREQERFDQRLSNHREAATSAMGNAGMVGDVDSDEPGVDERVRTSSSRKSRRPRAASKRRVTLRWVRTAALGRPVEPEVWIT